MPEPQSDDAARRLQGSPLRRCLIPLLLLCAGAAVARDLDHFKSGWTSADHPPVKVSGTTAFPLPMSRVKDRVYWDREMKLNLEAEGSFVLELLCPAPEAVRAVTLSFRSGPGWYSADAPLTDSGSTSLQFARSEFRMEGKPTGWAHVSAIRISCWKGEPVSTRLFPVVLRTGQNRLMLVECDTSVFPPGERAYANRFAQRVSGWLKELRIEHGTIHESKLDGLSRTRAKVLILPFNPRISKAATAPLATFARAGGKLIVFGESTPHLAALMEVRLGARIDSKEAGRWDQVVFSSPDPAFPERLYNHAWRLRPVYPAGKGKVIATWEDARRKPSGSPAIVESATGFWMGAVLIDGDRAGKQRMLCGMVGRYLPEIWKPVAMHGLRHNTRIASYPSFKASRDAIAYRTRGSRLRPRIEPMLEQADSLYATQQRQFTERAYRGSTLTGHALKGLLVKADAMVQPGRRGELRGIWDHNGTGLYAGGWNHTAAKLKSHGINAVFPNMMWGGKSHVPSKLLPPSKTLQRYGDQLRECLRACEAHDIDVHVWKVCWKLEGASAAVVKKMREAGRLQVNAAGETLPWLCPSHPANQDLEINSLLEVARTYPVAGIHLDYIRYPGRDSCYSPATRAAFEKWYGRKVVRWPEDVVHQAPLAASYEKFRAGEITRFVQRLSREVKAARPDLKLSAAVFGKYPSCINSIGQDWVAWVKAGLVDFVVPMNYTADPQRFESWLENQNELTGNHQRILPGIGMTASESELSADQVAEQVRILRRHRNPGFVLFKLDSASLRRTLPMLGAGLLKE